MLRSQQISLKVLSKKSKLSKSVYYKIYIKLMQLHDRNICFLHVICFPVGVHQTVTIAAIVTPTWVKVTYYDKSPIILS